MEKEPTIQDLVKAKIFKPQPKNYRLSDCEDLICMYVNEFGGECTELREGVLGLGTVLLHGATGKKTILIEEFYLNEWSSGHTIRMFNKMPKKYAKQLEELEFLQD